MGMVTGPAGLERLARSKAQSADVDEDGGEERVASGTRGPVGQGSRVGGTFRGTKGWVDFGASCCCVHEESPTTLAGSSGPGQ